MGRKGVLDLEGMNHLGRNPQKEGSKRQRERGSWEWEKGETGPGGQRWDGSTPRSFSPVPAWPRGRGGRGM